MVSAAVVKQQLKAAVPVRKAGKINEVTVSAWRGNNNQLWLNSVEKISDLSEASVSLWFATAREQGYTEITFEAEVGGNPDMDVDPDYYNVSFPL